MSDTLRVSNLHFGNAASNYNQPQMGFTSVGIGSTANYGFLQFFGTSNTLCWTANGTVGIGTTAPQGALDVNGIVYVGTGANVGGQGMYINTGWINSLNYNEYAPFQVAIRNTKAFVINTNSYVGIGTTTPLVKLQIGEVPINGDVTRREMFRGVRDGTVTVQNSVSMAFALGASTGAVNPYGCLDIKVNGYPGAPNNYGSIPDVTVMSVIGNGMVGIGITNPTTTLHVVGSTSVGTPAVVSFVNNGGGPNGTGSDIVNSQITMGLYGPYIRSVQRNSVYTDGMRLDLCTNIGSNDGAPVPRISILSGLFGGYVGIGSTNPTTALDVVGAISSSGTFTKNGTTTGYYTSIEGGTATNSGYVNFVANGSSRGYIGNASTVDLDVVAQNGAQLNFYTAGAKRLSIGTTGNITQAGGIFYKNSATVTSYMTISGGDVNNSPFIEYYYGGSRRCYIGNTTASEVQFACENGAQFALYTAGSSRLTVTPGGNVGIGIANPSTPLHVVGSSTINVTMVAWMTKGSGGLATSASTSFSTVSIYAAGSIWAGDVIGCANVTSFSDQRIKKNIQSVNDVFDLIQKIEVVSYEHIDKRKKSVKYGVVAQQLRPFLPEVIDTTKNWIPTPFLFATSHTRYGNQVIIAVDASSPELQIGRKIRLYIQYDNKDTEYDTEIIDLTTSSITCKVWDAYHDIDSVFVYGVEVDDFLVVDKQQLGLLALAGVQEVHKMVSVLQAQNEMLLSQNAALQARMDALEALLTTLS